MKNSDSHGRNILDKTTMTSDEVYISPIGTHGIIPSKLYNIRVLIQ